MGLNDLALYAIVHYMHRVFAKKIHTVNAIDDPW